MISHLLLAGTTPAASAAAETLRVGSGCWLSRNFTGLRLRALEIGATHSIGIRSKENEMGVRAALAVLVAPLALKSATEDGSIDAASHHSMLTRPIDTPMTSDFDLTAPLQLAKAAIKTTIYGFRLLCYKTCSSNWVLTGSYQVDAPVNGGAPISNLGDRYMYRTHQKRGRANAKDDEGEQDEAGGGDGDGRRRPKRQQLDPAEDPQYFACPFYKFDPQKHWRCYRKYGFRRVSDVKNHIRRIHIIGEYYCAICFAEFEDFQSWQLHAQGNTCQLIQGPERLFSQEFEELDQAFSGARGLSDRDKWYLLFDHIFPNAPRRPTSPYVRSTFDEPLEIMREHAFMHESRNSNLLAILLQYGIPLQGIDLVSLRSDLINAVLPISAPAMATNPPYQRPVASLHALLWDQSFEPQNQLQQNLQSQRPQAEPDEDQQQDQQPPEQPPEQP